MREKTGPISLGVKELAHRIHRANRETNPDYKLSHAYNDLAKYFGFKSWSGASHKILKIEAMFPES